MLTWLGPFWNRAVANPVQSSYHQPGVFVVMVSDEDRKTYPELVDLTEVYLYKDAVGGICTLND